MGNLYRILLCGCLLGFRIIVGESVSAQQIGAAMSWEEASMQAARENKLVFVAVEIQPDIKTFAVPEVKHFFMRNTLALRMDMQSPAGKRFEPKLLLTPFPVYAFFMPFGDLLTTVTPQEVVEDPQALIEAGRKALEIAELKRNNSRSIRFEKLVPDQEREKEEKERLRFVYFRRPDCRECLQMEKNVFNLNRVADFYNRQFRPLEVPGLLLAEWASRYKVEELPAYLFLNSEGKVVYRAKAGFLTADDLLREGETALQKAKGIDFTDKAWPDVLTESAEKHKLIFVDSYVLTGGERRSLIDKVYRDPDVSVFFNNRFTNVEYDVNKPEGAAFRKKYGLSMSFALCFLDEKGKMLHQLAELPDTEELLKEAVWVLNGGGLASMREEYRQGNRDEEFIRRYIRILDRAGEISEAEEVTAVYLEGTLPEQLREKKYWELFRAYFQKADSDLFRWLCEHRTEFYTLFGPKEVDDKIEAVWTAGAGSFVKEQSGDFVFDGKGFKEYEKRLKKEKVKNRVKILRNARMEAAEKTGDWRTFSNLAEERWNEEQIPEAELYNWGVIINEHCRDKSIRYKAARWFALAASEIEEKERKEGRVRISSYKGFFEKLVNDLLEE